MDTDIGENLDLEHGTVLPPQLPTQLHFDRVVVSATSRKVPAAQPFVTALLQLPFVAGVNVHVALVGLPQLPALQVNVADPVRQEAELVNVALTPELVVLAAAEHLPQVSDVPMQSIGQDSVCCSAGLGVGHPVLPHGQLTVLVRV